MQEVKDVSLIDYTYTPEYEQCEARFGERYRVRLARVNTKYRYEVRDPATIEYLFDDRPVINRDHSGPIVLVEVRRSAWGAVVTTFWDLSRSRSEQIYNTLDAVRSALLNQLESGPVFDLLLALTRYSQSWDEA